MLKNCIFNSKKTCSDCGECETCELNASKKCDNCSKCLELEGYDVKAIKINEVIENKEEIHKTIKLDKNSLIKDKVIKLDDIMKKSSKSKVNKEKEENSDKEHSDNLVELESVYGLDDHNSNETFDIMDNEEMWEYIEDVKDLSEILNDEKLFGEIAEEQFPGFVVLKGNK